MTTKTYSQKPADVSRQWYVIDATDVSLGRIATEVAQLLAGKQKPTFTPHTDGGDHVVVINSSKIRVTGNKLKDKIYYRHSGYPGSTKATSLGELMEKKPAAAVESAVYGMLPKNKLRDDRMHRLKVYAGEEHQHAAQKPVVYDITKGKK